MSERITTEAGTCAISDESLHTKEGRKKMWSASIFLDQPAESVVKSCLTYIEALTARVAELEKAGLAVLLNTSDPAALSNLGKAINDVEIEFPDARQHMIDKAVEADDATGGNCATGAKSDE